MKKTVLFLLSTVLMLSLCGCGNDSPEVASSVESSHYSEISDSSLKEGCFYDSVTELFDSFGEKTGEKHVLKADAIGYTREGNKRGKVTLLLNDYDKSWVDSFYFATTYDDMSTGYYVVFDRILYNIDYWFL